MAPPRLEIRARRGPVALVGWALLAVTAAALVVGAYRAGAARGGAAGAALAEARAELANERERRRALEARLAAAERAAQVDRAAVEKARAELRALREEVAELRQELAFYRGVVVQQGKAREGIAVRSFQVLAVDTNGTWPFRLVLARNPKGRAAAVAGRVRLWIEGRMGEAERTAGPEALGPAASPRFRFRHFQELRGALRLPEGFVPRRVRIEVRPAGRAEKPVEMAFPWAAGRDGAEGG